MQPGPLLGSSRHLGKLGVASATPSSCPRWLLELSSRGRRKTHSSPHEAARSRPLWEAGRGARGHSSNKEAGRRCWLLEAADPVVEQGPVAKSGSTLWNAVRR